MTVSSGTKNVLELRGWLALSNGNLLNYLLCDFFSGIFFKVSSSFNPIRRWYLSVVGLRSTITCLAASKSANCGALKVLCWGIASYLMGLQHLLSQSRRKRCAQGQNNERSEDTPPYIRIFSSTLTHPFEIDAPISLSFSCIYPDSRDLLMLNVYR